MRGVVNFAFASGLRAVLLAFAGRCAGLTGIGIVRRLLATFLFMRAFAGLTARVVIAARGTLVLWLFGFLFDHCVLVDWKHAVVAEPRKAIPFVQ